MTHRISNMFKIAKDIFGSKVYKNASWLIMGSMANKIVAFIVGVWTARHLGPSNFGIINYALAYTAFFFSLCTLGINSVIIKEFIDVPDEEGETLGTTIVLQVLSSVMSVFMITGIVFLVDFGETDTLVVSILCSIGLVFQMIDVFRYWFQARLMSKYYAVAALVAYIVSSLYKVVLIINGAKVYWFALATSVDYICVAVILYWSYRKNKGPALSFSSVKAKKLLKGGCHYILAGLMVSIYVASDRLMLKEMVNESEVGYYSTAVSICNFWVFVLAAIIDSFYPIIMEYKKSDERKYIKKNCQLYSIIFYLSISVSLLISLFADWGISFLYGYEFLPAILPLRIATWYVAFSFLGVARNAWMVSEYNQKYLTPMCLLSALLNIILNLFFIPRYQASGAAMASLLTQISTIFLFPLFFKAMRPNVKMMLSSITLGKYKCC